MEISKLKDKIRNKSKKPVFLSRKKRAALKQQKIDEEKELLQLKQQELKQNRKQYEEFNCKCNSTYLNFGIGKAFQRKKEKEKRQLERSRRKEESKRKSQNQRSRSRKYQTSNPRAKRIEHIDLGGKNKEIEAIKKEKLGLNKEKKAQILPTQKFSNIFNFDWNVEDDTSKDINPLYMNQSKLPLLFGRGRIGGIDFEQQIQTTETFQPTVKRWIFEKDKKGKTIKRVINSRRNRSSSKIKQKHMVLGQYVHWSQKREKDMTERDWRIFREDNQIIIKGGKVPRPLRYWRSYSIPERIMSSIRSLRFKKPTPIQMQAIPIGMTKRDLIGIAPTGSGKSIAFLTPLLIHLQDFDLLDPLTSREGPYALILAPARELILQLDETFKLLARNTDYRSQVIVGGRSIDDQTFKLREGAEVIIATPGRLRDLLQNGYMVLNQCNWVIIDEADKMVDLGFEEDLKYILDSMPKQFEKSKDESKAELQERLTKAGSKQYRVTHMFSATMGLDIEKLARKYLRNNVYVSIGEPGAGIKSIKQHTFLMQECFKKKELYKRLDLTGPPIIIFMKEKRGVELITKNLQKRGYSAITYHGGKSQQHREKAINRFKDGLVDILVCTDLGGRGLDVEGVQHVINFDAPRNIATYIHRIGRTGRAGLSGVATTFLTKYDEEIFHDLVKFLKRNNQNIPEELANHPMTSVKRGKIPKNKPRREQKIFAQSQR